MRRGCQWIKSKSWQVRLAPAKSKSAGAEASIPVRSQKPARPCAVEQERHDLVLLALRDFLSAWAVCATNHTQRTPTKNFQDFHSSLVSRSRARDY